MKECTTTSTDKLIVLSENKSKIIFKNTASKKIKKIIVDGCAIKNGIKCDFLIIDDNEKEFFVELKGTDITHAFEQLSRSIELLSKSPKSEEKHSFVISTRSPLISSKLQKYKLNFKKQFNSSLLVKNGSWSVQI